MKRTGSRPPARSSVDRRLAPADLPAFLTIEEVCKYLGIGLSSGYKFAKVHGVRFGDRNIRVPREALVREG